MKFITIHVNFPTEESAKSVSSELLKKRFIAWVNYYKIESSYHWKWEIHYSDETVAVLKTRLESFEKIEAFIKENHPYETPCIIKNEVTANKDYVDWIYKETV